MGGKDFNDDKAGHTEFNYDGQEVQVHRGPFCYRRKARAKISRGQNLAKQNGFSSTAEYLAYASEIVLSAGLFPHTNAGNLTKVEMNELKKTNVSLGLMLENTSERLSGKNMPHEFAPSKNPKARIKVLENAGELRIPMTTGLLIGIGESPFELIESIYAIKEIHKKFGHIQEIILQNFQPKPDTVMKDIPSPQERYFRTFVALTRVIMPEMNIQIPPNLSPISYFDFLSVGINDWGGISPITPDYVNPEFPWPSIESIERNCTNAGFQLRARLPIYPEFMSFVSSNLKSKIMEIADSGGFVREGYLK